MVYSADLTDDQDFDTFLRRALSCFPKQQGAAQGWERLAPRLATLSSVEPLSPLQVATLLVDRPGPHVFDRVAGNVLSA
ncbi:hypothetical protein [Hymenobacter defluvii]|uniref:Uncharacterized protein n=1 Tax=Hymenobacter defluvii TaxID=2054411 RepID=A0ABS3TEK2_9BACT|nr:hypothetical protein [Hymenobacter defluvii]MBO3272086.1 hypothetical protein [Hymenobacter defluvii]